VVVVAVLVEDALVLCTGAVTCAVTPPSSPSPSLPPPCGVVELIPAWLDAVPDTVVALALRVVLVLAMVRETTMVVAVVLVLK
jgi:hypothetical protein